MQLETTSAVCVSIICLLLVGVTRANSDDPKIKIVEAYFAAVNRHDPASAIDLLAPEIDFGKPDATFRLTHANVRTMLGWDLATRGSSTLDGLTRDGVGVTGNFTETNEFLKRVGIGQWTHRFRVDFEGGRIVSFVLERTDAGPGLDDLMAPLLEWARQHHPAELEQVYPGGNMVFSRESAEIWLALLRRWPDRPLDRR